MRRTEVIKTRVMHEFYRDGENLIVLDQIAQAHVVSWTPWINFSFALQRLVA